MAKVSQLFPLMRQAVSAGQRGKLLHFVLAHLRSALASRSRTQHVLYRLDKSALRDAPADLDVRIIAAEDDIPDWAVRDKDAEAMPREWYLERIAEGATGWIARAQGQFAACLWLIKGRALQEWYVPIQPQDRVLYAVVTASRSRGSGMAPKLVCTALGHDLAPDADTFVDCKVWNKSARRAFEKVGFRSFATVEAGKFVPVLESDAAS